MLLAILVFAAGAASGGFLGGRRAASTPATIGIAARDAANFARTHPSSVGEPHPAGVRQTSVAEPRAASPTTPPKSSAHRALSRPNRVPRGDHRSQLTPAEQKQRRPVPATWVANVLGVTAEVDSGGVRLVWQRPAESDHVAVLRAFPGRERPAVVFRGRAGAYRDASVRRCTVYRYSIVNYVDGHRSTGVPTSVVTTGCA
jgi:hypothetical protein